VRSCGRSCMAPSASWSRSRWWRSCRRLHAGCLAVAGSSHAVSPAESTACLPDDSNNNSHVTSDDVIRDTLLSMRSGAAKT